MFALVCFDHPFFENLTYNIPENFQGKSLLHCRVQVEVGKEKHVGLVVEVSANTIFSFDSQKKTKDINHEKIKPILRVIDKHAIITQEQMQLAKLSSDYYGNRLGQFLFAMIPSGRSYSKTALPWDEADDNSEEKKIHPLNKEQKKVFQDILNSDKQKTTTHLLYGVTGSGKTRVYIELIKHYVQEGFSVLLLLPEIAISYQLLSVLKPVFKNQLAYLHSSLSTAQRFSQYRRILNREANIVLGTRSAVFAPLQNIGLIIFDEEHDSSFKQNRQPRYNAKRIAHIRLNQNLKNFSAQHPRLPLSLLLASATPSVESYYYAQQNIFSLHRLTKRATGLSLPNLIFSQLEEYHDHQILTELSMEKMREHLGQGNQVLIILNRRGHSNYAFCRSCKEREGCPNCSVALSYHEEKNSDTKQKQTFLKCHLCGYQKPYTGICSHCGKKLKLVGKGTQKAENFIEKHFSQFSYARLDHDSASQKDYSKDVIQAMHDKKIDILLGTQMIAKGFDLPHVTLVIIANADIGLNLPDFRAMERVFQLLVQSAGRSGRHNKGEVVIQSAQPDHYVLQSVFHNNHELFYNQEIEMRKTFGYPPFTKMIRYVLLSKDEESVQKMAAQFSLWLEEQKNSTSLFAASEKNLSEQLPSQILPLQEAPLYRLNKEFRFHLLAKDNSPKKLFFFVSLLEEFSKRFIAKGKNVRDEIDVDPLDVL